MKILVTVKQVPDTSGKVAVNPDGTLDRASMQTIINPDDLNAVEAALALKDELGCKVVAFTMGPPPAEGMLRELMAMGVDEGVLITAREFGGSDTYATSQIIAAGIDTYGVEDDDIILAGRQAIDGDTAQVGPQIAEKLHLPQITYAGEIKKDGNTLTVKRGRRVRRLFQAPGHHDLRDPEGSPPDRCHYHRPEGFSHQHSDLLHASSEGRRHDARRRRQGDHRQAGRHPGRQAHHLRKEIRKWLLIVLISARSKMYGYFVSSARAR